MGLNILVAADRHRNIVSPDFPKIGALYVFSVLTLPNGACDDCKTPDLDDHSEIQKGLIAK